MRKPLNFYAQEARKTSKEHGWYDSPKSVLTNYALLYTEPSEATEETRNHKDYFYYEGKDNKPEGEAIELIDLVIRILDTLGEYNDNHQFVVEYNEEQILFTGNELEVHALLQYMISQAMMQYFNGNILQEKIALEKIVYCVKVYFNRMKWDFERLLLIKMNYNKSRPYRHNNKKF